MSLAVPDRKMLSLSVSIVDGVAGTNLTWIKEARFSSVPDFGDIGLASCRHSFSFGGMRAIDGLARLHTARPGVVSSARTQPRPAMIDVDRPFLDQDPFDRNVRSGIEGSGVGTWDLELSTRELTWSNTTRKLFGV